VRVFKTKEFGKFARKHGIADEKLCEAIARAEHGEIDAQLRKDVIKQRVGRKNQSRRRGFRTLLAFRLNTRAIFIHGFAKNAQDNVTKAELSTFGKLAKIFLDYKEEQVTPLLETGEWSEVRCNDQEIQE
jgi:hypothetical protein